MPVRAVKEVSIMSASQAPGKISWLKASAYSVEDSRLALSDGDTYLAAGHLFMCGGVPKPLLRFNCAVPVALCANTTRIHLCLALKGRGTITQVTNLKRSQGGDV
jgi:hypothetical protein